jgi:hypothetical protein
MTLVSFAILGQESARTKRIMSNGLKCLLIIALLHLKMRDKVRDKSLTCLLPLTKFPPIAHIGTQQWRFNCGSFSSGVDHEGASRVAIRKSAPATSPVLNSQFDAAETRGACDPST